MNRIYDIAVVGSGFAGSITAMIAKRLGYSVALLEQGKHPRVVIGESSTPLSNLLLEELATRYDLPALRPLTKWGSWQRSYPQIACGLKRGFTFYHHRIGIADAPDPEHLNQLLVAASPHNEIADTHWYRADFDALLVTEAQSLGIDYVDEVKLERVIDRGCELRLEGNKDGREIAFRAKFVVDATGPRGFLHRALVLPEITFPNYPATQALYSHFSNVQRPEVMHNTLEETPPYPEEDAAVHHIFDGGWVWVLRFNNGITSAGIAATESAAARMNLSDGEEAWKRLLDSIPALKSQFATAEARQPFRYIPKLSFLSERVYGNRWVLLPSAVGFVDPLLSTGFPLTLLGISRLAKVLEHDWNSPRFSASLEQYATETTGELLATSRLISSLYANMNNFPVFRSLSLLYFAAASFSETARRLNKPHLANSFLLHDHPAFGPQYREIYERALHIKTGPESLLLMEDVLHAIAPIDMAGLTNTERRHWYPVDAEDLLRSASKVEATRDEIGSMLESSGFYLQNA